MTDQEQQDIQKHQKLIFQMLVRQNKLMVDRILPHLERLQDNLKKYRKNDDERFVAMEKTMAFFANELLNLKERGPLPERTPMYAHIDNFAVDKMVNTIVEEGFAPVYIIEYHRRRARRINRVEKNLGDYQQQKRYDLVDTLGIRWEVKHDRAVFNTGNVYVELQSLLSSEADKYLIFAGLVYVIPVYELWVAIAPYLEQTKGGGDNLRSIGVLLPLEVLERYAEEVIVL